MYFELRLFNHARYTQLLDFYLDIAKADYQSAPELMLHSYTRAMQLCHTAENTSRPHHCPGRGPRLRHAIFRRLESSDWMSVAFAPVDA